MKIQIVLDQDGSGSEYDKILNNKEIPEPGSCTMVTKSNGTKSGRPIVMLIVPIKLQDGSDAAVPIHFTAREFVGMAAAVQGCHPDCGDRDQEMLTGPLPEQIHDKHRGVAFDAIAVERVFLVSVENDSRISIAGSRKEVVELAKTMIDHKLDS